MNEDPKGNADSGDDTLLRRLGPTVAGTWYTADPLALAQQIDDYLDVARSQPETTGAVRALIAPHAGFRYSGAIAGRAFAGLHGAQIERVVLLGPSHHARFPGAAVPRAELYRTPLGETEIDTEVIASLGERTGFRIDDTPFRPEHCLEAEILFLQRVLPANWSLLPLLIGAASAPEEIASVAEGLRPWITPRTLIVVSSDFTHFGPRFRFVPFQDDLPRRIEQLDMGALERILACDPDGFTEYVERTGATICGRDAIDVLLRLLPGNLDVTLAAYDTSGRMTGSWDHSVSYASLLFREPSSERTAP